MDCQHITGGGGFTPAVNKKREDAESMYDMSMIDGIVRMELRPTELIGSKNRSSSN